MARLVQLGVRQARYIGRTKTQFQLLMAATVANLTLVAGKVGRMGGIYSATIDLSASSHCSLAAISTAWWGAILAGRRGSAQPGYFCVTTTPIAPHQKGFSSALLANIGFGMGWVVVVAGAFAYTGMESFNMLAERYARRQREEGRQEGRQEVRQVVLDQLEKLSHLSYEEHQAEIGRLIDETRRIMDGEGKGS